MNTNNKLFISVRCQSRNIPVDGKAIEDSYVETENPSFTLIGDALVPESFIERVFYEMASTYYTYGMVLKKEDMFFENFLDSLKPDEHEVLMHVVLELMARGVFPLHLAPETDLARGSRFSARCDGI